jgi:hypothetical protein
MQRFAGLLRNGRAAGATQSHPRRPMAKATGEKGESDVSGVATP